MQVSYRYIFLARLPSGACLISLSLCCLCILSSFTQPQTERYVLWCLALRGNESKFICHAKSGWKSFHNHNKVDSKAISGKLSGTMSELPNNDSALLWYHTKCIMNIMAKQPWMGHATNSKGAEGAGAAFRASRISRSRVTQVFHFRWQAEFPQSAKSVSYCVRSRKTACPRHELLQKIYSGK